MKRTLISWGSGLLLVAGALAVSCSRGNGNPDGRGGAATSGSSSGGSSAGTGATAGSNNSISGSSNGGSSNGGSSNGGSNNQAAGGSFNVPLGGESFDFPEGGGGPAGMLDDCADGMTDGAACRGGQDTACSTADGHCFCDPRDDLWSCSIGTANSGPFGAGGDVTCPDDAVTGVECRGSPGPCPEQPECRCNRLSEVVCD